MRLIPLINLRIEPRASSSGSVHQGDSVPGCTPQTVCMVGVPRGVYPGIYGDMYTHHGVYPGIYRVYYTHHGTGCIYRVYYTHHGARVPYQECTIPTMVPGYGNKSVLYPPWCPGTVERCTIPTMLARVR